MLSDNVTSLARAVKIAYFFLLGRPKRAPEGISDPPSSLGPPSKTGHRGFYFGRPYACSQAHALKNTVDL